MSTHPFTRIPHLHKRCGHLPTFSSLKVILESYLSFIFLQHKQPWASLTVSTTKTDQNSVYFSSAPLSLTSPNCQSLLRTPVMVLFSLFPLHYRLALWDALFKCKSDLIPPLLIAFLQYPMVPGIRCAHLWSWLTRFYLFWPLPSLTGHLLFQFLCGTQTPGTMTWTLVLEHTSLIGVLGLCTSCFLKTQDGHSQKSSLKWLLLTIQVLALFHFFWKVDSCSHFSYYLPYYLVLLSS